MYLDEQTRGYITDKIAERGYACVTYVDARVGVTAVTTVGLTHRGWPELTLNSSVLKVEGMITIIAYIVSFWEKEGEAVLGYTPVDCFNDYEVQYRVTLLTTENLEWNQILHDYYCVDGLLPIVAQICYPDAENNLPGDANYTNYLGQTLTPRKVH